MAARPTPPGEFIIDQVPDRVSQRARGAFRLRDPHVLVADLAYDSAVDEPLEQMLAKADDDECTRVLRFRCHRLTAEVVVHGDGLERFVTLQVTPPTAVSVEVHSPQGRLLTTATSSDGSVDLGCLPYGVMSLILEPKHGRRVQTAWVPA